MGKKDRIEKEVKQILQHAHGSMTAKELRRQAGVKDKSRFRQVLDEMKGKGKITISRSHIVELVREENTKRRRLFRFPRALHLPGRKTGNRIFLFTAAI